MKIADFLIELYKLIGSQQKAKKPEVANVLLAKYKAELTPEQFLGLQRCLKAFNISFAGEEGVELVEAPYHEPAPPNAFGQYFNNELYQKAYALSAFVYWFEQNGIAEEHATKMAVIFNDANAMMSYLKKIADSALNVQKETKKEVRNVFHDAFLFSLPTEILTPNFDFSFWKDFAHKKNGELMLRNDFKALLPFASPIQQLVKGKEKEAKANNIKPADKDIKAKTAEYDLLFKEYRNLERQKGRLNKNQEKRYEQLTGLVSEKKRELAKCCYGKPLNKLTLLEIVAFYEEYKYNASEAYKIFLDNDIPGQFYATFERLNRQEAGNNIPDVTIDGKTIGHEGYYLRKVPVQDELEAARAACFGKMTGCCQSLSGELGQPCVIHGLTSPNGGFYVLCQGDSQHPKVTDFVAGQCWAWRSQTNAIVFDSIEMAPGEDKNMVAAFYNHLGEKLVLEKHTDKVACGGKSGISNMVGVSVRSLGIEQFIDYNDYSDSKEQRVIYDKNRPYLLYDLHEPCKERTHQFIEKLVNSDAPLAANTTFIEMLNYALIQSPGLIQAIENEIVNVQKKEELNKITQLMNEYLECDIVDVPAVLEKLIQNPALINIVDSTGCTPLMRAAANGNVNTFFRLIEKGADSSVRDFHGNTPLMLAAKNDHLELCNALIDKGADVNAKNNDGNTPLMLAAANGHLKLCEALIDKGADMNVTNNQRLTPLILAFRKGHIELYEALIDKGADVNAKNAHGNTLLMLAVKDGRLQDFKALIIKGAEVNTKNTSGETPLHWAAKNGELELCNALIDKGADVNAKNNYGEIPWMWAAERGHADVCLALIQYSDADTLNGELKEAIAKMKSDSVNDALEKRLAELKRQQAQTETRKPALTPMLHPLNPATSKAEPSDPGADPSVKSEPPLLKTPGKKGMT
ncbi:MAG: ankyrin repeat domain-containing protein [Candidatus Berkiella sp.]